jgi:hypothetical protein
MENKSILYICISIIIGFSILSISLFLNKDNVNKDNINRYQMISANENNLIIFDSQTGDYWRKFIESQEGPANWSKESVDLTK